MRLISILWIFLLCCLTASAARISELAAGDSPDHVQRLLGKPMGKMQSGHVAGWIYSDGTVYFKDNAVQYVKSKQAQPGAVSTPDPAPSVLPLPTATKEKEPDTPATNEAAFVYVPCFTRTAHPSAMYYNAVPVEFDDLSIPRELSIVYGYSLVASPMRTGAKAREFFRSLSRQLRKYPVPLLAATINCIYGVQSLKTATELLPYLIDKSSMSIYLTQAENFDTLYAELLLTEFPELFPSDDWYATGKPWYGHVIQGVNPETTVQNQQYNQGFLTHQAMTGMNADFSAIFTALVHSPPSLFSLADEYPIIRKKVDMTMDFLSKVLKKTTGRTTPLTHDFWMSDF